MRALIIQHDHVSPPGQVGDSFAERGFELVLHEVVPKERHRSPHGVTTTFPAIDELDAIVVMGAPWSAYDPGIASWLDPELDLLREADAREIPVLGICFGGQLLAMAHGGQVAKSPYPEIGFVDVHSLDDGLVPSGPWFQWHYDRWTLPPDAVEIARNAAASQAFVLRHNLAVQFHPELDSDMLDGWLVEGGDVEARAHGHDPQALLAQARATDERSRARAALLVEEFLDRRGMTWLG
jgi:GMP synthase-like glutamine amidotransferase